MIKDDGIRSIHQIQGEAPDGAIRNLKTDENGILKVVTEGQSPLPVEIKGGEVSSIEKVLNSGKIVLGTETQSLSINAKVTSILVANYSSIADVTMKIGEENILIASNIATELPINEDIVTINLVSNEADTTLYYIIKGIK